MKVYILKFICYLDNTFSQSEILGIYSSLEKANEASDRYVETYPLANGPDIEEILVIFESVLDKDDFQ